MMRIIRLLGIGLVALSSLARPVAEVHAGPPVAMASAVTLSSGPMASSSAALPAASAGIWWCYWCDHWDDWAYNPSSELWEEVPFSECVFEEAFHGGAAGCFEAPNEFDEGVWDGGYCRMSEPDPWDTDNKCTCDNIQLPDACDWPGLPAMSLDGYAIIDSARPMVREAESIPDEQTCTGFVTTRYYDPAESRQLQARLSQLTI
jgi:hypothetical protein